MPDDFIPGDLTDFVHKTFLNADSFTLNLNGVFNVEQLNKFRYFLEEKKLAAFKPKFEKGQRVRRCGTQDIGEVYDIEYDFDNNGEVSATYEVHHSMWDNPHVGANFGGTGYESEFEAV